MRFWTSPTDGAFTAGVGGFQPLGFFTDTISEAGWAAAIFRMRLLKESGDR
jgi:hypothetical protein